MAYSVELSTEVDRELDKLDAQHSKSILKFLHARGSRPGEFWKYRVGDYRLICKIEDDRLIVLVLRIGDREEIYR